MTHEPGAIDGGEPLAELERLARQFPIPDPSWHGYVHEMREAAADLAAAVRALHEHPAALAALGELVAAGRTAAVGGGDDALAAASQRLRTLPLPAGEHPFLDEIRVTVDAAAHALAALASVPGGEEAFAAAQAAAGSAGGSTVEAESRR